ncbi:MAG: DUF262 domain-containing protein [Pedobacter sp.]|nr:MAG: DUF262 domain-containing protein [Pedobacter sp.]
MDDELSVEVEVDETPHVEFDISVSPSDPSLELLVNQLERDDIVIPFYQRRFVWGVEQASKLIESFLMGLPVPQIFLYVNAEDQLEVIDGQQRLLSVKYFMEGYFGEPDKNEKRQVFRLKGLAERSEFNGKLFTDLSPKDQRKLRNSTLRAINIKQIKPDDRNDSVFHIFERLNTGGTQLKPQEIRNAVYRGNVVKALSQLNKTPGWHDILGMKRPDKNQKDIELILRLYGLFKDWQQYEKPMLRYLNTTMSKDRAFDSPKAAEFQARFPEVVQKVVQGIKNPFRPKGVINSAVLESVMITLMEDAGAITVDDLQRRYEVLFMDQSFLETITGPTTDTSMLRTRIERAKEVLTNG